MTYKESKQIIKELIDSDTSSIMSITPEDTPLEFTKHDVEVTIEIMQYLWYRELRALFQPTED